ncbi:MAG: LysR family transcriptional regulator [Plesiomonas sp.]|uniref:LysR family transcriptional regulator n=1 Tax=Plesiomonas sp. TaxID=2486279 RepID=UPI003F3B8120
MRRTDLTLLYYFSVLYQEQNMTQAASKAFVSPLELSQQIMSLEQHYNQPLFERRQTYMLPTEFADHIYLHIKRILQEVDSLDHCVDNYKGETQQHLHIGVVQSVEPVINNLLRYALQQPKLSITITEAPIDTMLDKLNQHQLDMVIGHSVPLLASQIEQQPFCDDQLMVVLPPHHSLANQPQIYFNQLLDQNLILLPEPHITQTTLLQIARQHDLPLKISATLSQITAIMAAVNAHLGISVLPATAMQLLPDNTLVWRKLADADESQPIWVYYARDNKHHEQIQALISTLLTPCLC